MAALPHSSGTSSPAVPMPLAPSSLEARKFAASRAAPGPLSGPRAIGVGARPRAPGPQIPNLAWRAHSARLRLRHGAWRVTALYTGKPTFICMLMLISDIFIFHLPSSALSFSLLGRRRHCREHHFHTLPTIRSAAAPAPSRRHGATARLRDGRAWSPG